MRHQVTDIPPIVAKTTEYQLHTLVCPTCGTSNKGSLPKEVTLTSFGPRVQAIVGILTGKFHLSKRETEAFFEYLCGMEISLGSISNIEKWIRQALEGPVRDVSIHVEKAQVSNTDETGWKEQSGKRWLWTSVTPQAVYFLIRKSRGAQILKELLGEDFSGIVGSDRHSAYNSIPTQRRQSCWAHLIRDFKAFSERVGGSAEIGEKLLVQAKLLFKLWGMVKEKKLSFPDFQEEVAPIRREVHTLLQRGTSCGHAKTQRTCKRLLNIEDYLWTFTRVEGIEPTNNLAEQAIRSAVLWRKKSFGTQSQRGSEFVERIMTMVATLKKQGRNVVEYLTELCKATLEGKTAPPLIFDSA